MRASLVTAGASLTAGETEKPSPGPGQVLIRVRSCGVCGSDLHALAGGGVPLGSVMGHEFAGDVERVGEGVTAFAAGDRVTSYSAMPCGACDACRGGATVLCANWKTIGLGQAQGGFAEYVLSHESVLYHLPEGLSHDAASACEPLMVAMYAVRQSGIRAGARAAILGAGPIGLLVLQYLHVAGVEEVYVVEPNAARRAMAERCGASRAIDPRAEDANAAIVATTTVGPDVVFECAGAGGTLQSAAELVRRGGLVQLVGVNMGEDHLFVLPWLTKEIEIRGSLGGREEFPLGLQLLAQAKIDIEPLLTATIGLEDLGAAFADLLRGDTRHALVVCRPDGAGAARFRPTAAASVT